MGVIDMMWYKLTCPICHASESTSVSDKGSMYRGSDWPEFASFSKFDTQWTGGATKSPELERAVCKGCGASAALETEFGFARPKGF